MTNISVEEKINSYLKKNPDLKNLERDVIVSVMVQNGALTMTEAQKVSAFAKTSNVTSDMGTTVERAAQPVEQEVTTRQTALTTEQAQDLSIEYLSENLQSALDLYRSTDNGFVSEAYDGIKNLLGTELSSKNVGDVINKEIDCLDFLTKAKEGTLTKREYYEQNKERLREMIMKRFNEKDDTGVSYLNRFRGNLSEKEFAKKLDDYLKQTIDSIQDMQGIKDFQHNLIIADETQTEGLLQHYANEVKKQKPQVTTTDGKSISFSTTKLQNHPFETDEPMTFEETFALERGTEFSKEAFESLQQSKGEMSFATGAHNKTQELRNGVKQLMDEYNSYAAVHTMSTGTAGVTMTYGGQEPDASKRADKISEFFSGYYAASPESGKKDLDSIIEKQKLDLKITQNENGEMNIKFGALYKTDAEKNKALNTLMRVSVQEQDKKLNNFLGGKTYESFIETYQQDYKRALGEQNADELAKAMSDDQMSVVDKYTGIAQMGGMAMMVVGGILTITPAAPAGAGMLSLGGKIALGGMVAKNVFGFTEEMSRDNTSEERMTQLKKNLAMDIGGLIIGGAAGRQGMKVASQILQNGGNRALAMIAEKGTDFTLSVAGDLAMVGALNYDEGIAETLKNNGIGIVVSTVTGIRASKEMFRGEFDTQPHRGGAGVDDTSVRTNSPAGRTTEEDVLINQARRENPAEVANDRILSEVAKREGDGGMRLNTPERLEAELAFAERNPNAPVENLEVLSLVIDGKLKSTLTQRYEKAQNVFKDIAEKHSQEIQELADKYPNDNEAFAKGYVDILSREFGMEGFEPPIVFKDTSDADGYFNWTEGRIEINQNLTDKKVITDIVSHEFTHLLQFKDVLAQYGEQGLRDLIANDKSIPQNKKDGLIEHVSENAYNRSLLAFAKLENKYAPEGSIDSYLRRVYKNEITNTETEGAAYTNQLIEREAYNLGSENLGSNIDVRHKITSEGLSAADIEQLRKNHDIHFTEDGTVFSINENLEIVFHGKRLPAGKVSQTPSAERGSGGGMSDIQGLRQPESPRGPVLEGGIRADELDEVAPFAERLQRTPHVGDYIDVPETRLDRSDFRRNLRSLTNDIGEELVSDFTINQIIKDYDTDDIPKLNQLVNEMKSKFNDNGYVAKLFTAFANNQSIKDSKDFDLIKRLVNEFDDTPDNRYDLQGIAYIMNDRQRQATHILLDMSKNAPFSNAEDLRISSEQFRETNAFAALKRAASLKNPDGEPEFKLPYAVRDIRLMKDLIAGNNFTDEEIIKFHRYKKEISEDCGVEIAAKVLSSKNNSELIAEFKKAIASDNHDDILRGIQNIKPKFQEAVVPMLINEISDKTLKSLVKKNIINIQNPVDKIDFIERTRGLTNLSEIQDKYILGSITREMNKLTRIYNKKPDIRYQGEGFYSKLKREENLDKCYANLRAYDDIDRGLRNGESYTYGNATHYLQYMQSEFPERAAVFNDLVDKYQTLSPEEYKNYVNTNDAVQKLSFNDFLEVTDNVPFYVKDKKIEALKKYFEDNYRLEKSGDADTKKLLSHMYKNDYLSMLPKETAQICENIYDSFGVKVFLSNENDLESLRLIQNELFEWQKASKGEAVMPPVLDLSVIRQNYIDKTFVAGGFHVNDSHNIAINGENMSGIQHAIRHEIAHANDDLVSTYSGQIPIFQNGKLIEVIDIDKIIVHEEVPKLDADGNPVLDVHGNPVMEKKTNPDGTFVPDFSKCQYVDEFRNAGVAEWHIPYAYNNKAEFLAVAAEGDYTKYSKEFKELLVKMGLPKWIFDMKPKSQITSESNIYSAGKLSENYTPEQQVAISRSAETLFSSVTKHQEEIIRDYRALGVSSRTCRVKDLHGINEKIYRQLARIDEKIADLQDVDKYNAENLKKGEKPLTQEEADILIEQYNINKYNLINDYDTVHNTIQDSFGARLVMDDTSPAAVAKVHRDLLNAIDEGRFEILEINNYQGEGGIPYFSSVQIKQIQEHCRRQGYNVRIISDVNAPKGKETEYNQAYNSNKAVKQSGYTTCQMNIRHKNGVISEFQIRGKHINNLAESEHIFYDISEGKDVSRGNSAIKQLVSPLEDAVHNMAPRDKDGNLIKPLTPEYTAYRNYLTECYKHARNIELGISSQKPVLPPNVNSMLDMDNLMEIHAKIEDIKKAK